MDLVGDLQEVINRQCAISDSTDGSSSPPVYRSVSTLNNLWKFFLALAMLLYFWYN